MYRRCGLPYGFGSEPFVLSQNQSEPASIDEFIDFTPSERDSDGKKINETPMILGLEDEFFQRLAALITTAEISDMFILLTAIIATAHAKYRRDDEEDKDEEEWILNNVLMKNQNWETFKQGILALLMKLDTLACTQPSICWLPEFAQEKETYARSKTNSFSLVGFAQRISLPGSELLIDQARWEWIREKRGGFAFTTHYLEDTPVIKDIGTWEWEKTYLWCAVSTFYGFFTGNRCGQEFPRTCSSFYWKRSTE